jgi:formylmethanofuran dehydrogenase subunit E
VLWGCAAAEPRSDTDRPEWFYPQWLADAPHAPRFQVRDTVNKYGRYATQTKTITLKDLIKYHGHFCGGLVEGAVALRVAFDRLFPDGVVDRTDLQLASSNSACGGDVADYLSGARVRFGAYFIDPSLRESEYVVRRVSTGRTVRVGINAATYPVEVRALMRKIESGAFEATDLDRFQTIQWEYAKRLVSQSPGNAVNAADAMDYAWPEAPCRDLGRRRDNDLKGYPAPR